MANELKFFGDPDTDTGLTVIAKVYTPAGVQTGSDVTCTEVDSLAVYRGNMPAAVAGEYIVRFLNDSDDSLLGQGSFFWDGTQEFRPLDPSFILEGSLTLIQAMRVMLSSLAGKLSGAATTTVLIRDTTDSKNRIQATVDSSGNRSSVTLDGS
jgi:hypothetical protein